jgi:hypothetical protein
VQACHPPETPLHGPAEGGAQQLRAWVRRLAYSSSAYTPDANACTNERSHLRSSIASAVQFPLRKLPFFIPRGAPGLSPPCKRHRLRPWMAGLWHAAPARVLAPHRGACLKFLSRFSKSGSMGLSARFLCPLRSRWRWTVRLWRTQSRHPFRYGVKSLELSDRSHP